MRTIPLATMAWLPAALISTAVLAQPAPATGAAGNAATGTSAAAPAPAPAPAPAAGSQGPAGAPAAGGPGRGGKPRAALMTQNERADYQSKMLSMKTYDQCVAYQGEHRKLIEQRAKERGVPAPPAPRMNPCDRLRARGQFK